jgi:hypothetical protein
MIGSQPGQIVLKTLSQKHPTQKRTGRVTEVGEYLPSKHEILSSNSSAIPPRKKIHFYWIRVLIKIFLLEKKNYGIDSDLIFL